jgi:DNA-3-methyladenine glycosylase
MPLKRNFYLDTDTAGIARSLLGKLIVVPAEGERVSGMIVETEAYLGVADRAAHTYGGRRTPRNESAYLQGGHVYVFFVYGMYFQLNVVTGPVDHPNVVLIRALEPIDGIELMRRRRGEMRDRNLTSGPGKLCIAMAIDRTFDGEDLLGNRITIEKYRSVPEEQISVGKRIGIDYAGDDRDLPLRFWLTGNEYVSRRS